MLKKRGPIPAFKKRGHSQPKAAFLTNVAIDLTYYDV